MLFSFNFEKLRKQYMILIKTMGCHQQRQEEQQVK